jgi:insertion element IS1 protein InsB
VNQPLLNALHPDEVDVVIQRVEKAEIDEMWSYVGKKREPRWLWHAIDHHTGKVLAYVFGRRQDHVFLQLKGLLEPFGITRYDTDYWGTYTRHLDPDEHQPGKRNMQQIERKHLTLRTRIKRLTRKMICFSRSIQMHDIVTGLFVNRYEFGLPV